MREIEAAFHKALHQQIKIDPDWCFKHHEDKAFRPRKLTTLTCMKTGKKHFMDSATEAARFFNTSAQNILTLKTFKGYKIEVQDYA